MKLTKVLACVLMSCVIVFAQPKDEMKPATAQAVAPAKTEAKATPKAKEQGASKVLGGKIVTIDNAKNTITIRVKSGDYPVIIDGQTSLVASETKISKNDLKIGDYVTVNYLKLGNGERKAEKVYNKSFAAKPAPVKAEAQAKVTGDVKPQAAPQAVAQQKPQQQPVVKKEETPGNKSQQEQKQAQEATPVDKKESAPLQK